MATPATSWWGSEGRIRIYFDPAEEGARELAYETARKAKISDGFKGLKADIAVGIGAASVAAAMLPGDEAVDFVASAAEGDLKGMAIAGIGGIIPGANALGEVMDPARKAVGSVGDSEKALKKATDGLDSAGDTLKKAPDEAVAKLEKKVEDAVEEGAAVAPPTTMTPGAIVAPSKAVIGKLKDLQNLGPGENSLLKHLQPDLGSAKANWYRNSSVLRQEMDKGLPIRDASLLPSGELAPYPNTFLDMERNLLKNHGWSFNSSTGLWSPPTP